MELPEDDDFDTVAGFVLERLGRVPVTGESLESDGLRFTVLEATPTRIEQVAVERLEAVSGEPSESGASEQALDG